MEKEYHERSVFMNGVAKILNAGGIAAVYTYDATAGALKKAVEVVQNSPASPLIAAGIFSGWGAEKSSQIKEVEERIKDYEIKIEMLYFEIGKEGDKYSAEHNLLEIEEIKKLIAGVREYEKEIQRLENRIKEIKEQKKTEKKIEKKRMRAKVVPFAQKPDKATVEQVKRKVEFAIDNAVKKSAFASHSDREIFGKVAQDLLNNEIEIKVLAAGELGKIKNNAAVPILLECLNFNDPDLDIEILNAFIAIGDARAIPVFKEKTSDARFKVRLGCVRGLYKLADDQEARPFLMKALQDENAEVRRTAATFIGWKNYDDAVPALVPCLRDETTRVRKAVVSALANFKDESAVLPLIKVLADKNLEIRQKAFEAVRAISGKEIPFDVNASGKQLKEEVKNLKDWWQKERLGKTEVEADKDVLEPETAAAEVAEAETETARKVVEPEPVTAEAAKVTPATAEPQETEKTKEETPSTKTALAAPDLKTMSRAELIAICQERGLEFAGHQLNADIIQVIMDGSR